MKTPPVFQGLYMRDQTIALFILLFFCTTFSYAETLRVGSTMWPGYEPLYLAQEIKAYKKNIRMINYPSNNDVLRAFRNKSIEAAALTLDGVVALEESGVAVDIILVLDISEGADVILAKPELKNMRGLIGRKVALESSGVEAYTLTRALELNQIDINKVSLINIENSSHKQAYLSGLADAVVTYEPIRTQLLNAGAIEVFSSKEIPGEIVDVLVVHKEFLSSHEDELFDISQGWFKALKELKDEPVGSYKFIASRMKISAREAKESYYGLSLPSLEKNRKLLSGNPAPLIKTFKRLTQHMKNNHLIAPSFSSLTTINNQFLPSR